MPARLVALAVLAAVVVGADLAHGQAAPATRTVLARGDLAAVGFLGDEAVALGDGELVAISGAGARRRLAAIPLLRQAAVSDALVAVVTSNADLRLSADYIPIGSSAGAARAAGAARPARPARAAGAARTAGVARAAAAARDRTVLRVGPPGGPLAPLVTCTGGDATAPELDLPPAVAGAAVAWRSCDGRGVVVRDGATRRDLRAGGLLLALAAAGRRVGWIARPSRDEPAALHMLDLDSGIEAPPAALGDRPAVRASLAMAPDGRLRADIQSTGERDDECQAFTLRDGRLTAGALTSTDYLCTGFAYTASGNLSRTFAPKRTGGSLHGLALTGPDGITRELVRQWFVTPEVAVSGDRVLTSRRTCTASELALEPAAPAKVPALPACPLTIARGKLRASPSGLVRVRIRCPAACRPAFSTLDLAGESTLLASSDDQPRVRAGGRATVTFRLDRPTRRELSARKRLRVRVVVHGWDFAPHPATRTLYPPLR